MEDRYKPLRLDDVAGALIRDGEAVPFALSSMYNFRVLELKIVAGQEAQDRGDVDGALSNYWHILKSGRNSECGELNPARDRLVEYAHRQVNSLLKDMRDDHGRKEEV
jgi:hypothetical protein